MDLGVIPHSFTSNIPNIAIITILSFISSYLPKMLPTFKNLPMDSASHGFLLGFFLHELKHSISGCALYYPVWLLDLIHNWTPEVFFIVKSNEPSSIPASFQEHSYRSIIDTPIHNPQIPTPEPKSFISKVFFKFFVNLVLLAGSYFKFFVMLTEYIFDEIRLTFTLIAALAALIQFREYKYTLAILFSVGGIFYGKYRYFWLAFAIISVLKRLFSNGIDSHSHGHSHGHSHEISSSCDDHQKYSSISVAMKLFPFFCDAVAEGIVLIKERDHTMDRITALISLAIHKILEAGTIVGQTIYRSKMSDTSKLVLCITYSLVIPVSSLLFSYLDKASISDDGESIVPQITISTLLHIVIFEVAPEMLDSGISILMAAISMLLVIDVMELMFGGAH